MNNKGEVDSLVIIIPFGLMFAVGLISLCMWGCPRYSVYEQGMDGESQLAKAEYSKKVQVQDALGKLEAAKSLAAAEIERAKGVAEANRIIGNSLKNNEDYLRYLWIHNLDQAEQKGAQVIYVPTEAQLPILEAGKRH